MYSIGKRYSYSEEEKKYAYLFCVRLWLLSKTFLEISTSDKIKVNAVSWKRFLDLS